MNKLFSISILCTAVYCYSAENHKPDKFNIGSAQRTTGQDSKKVRIAISRKRDLGNTGAAVHIPVGEVPLPVMPTIPELPANNLPKKTSPTIRRVVISNVAAHALTEDMRYVKQMGLTPSSMGVQGSPFNEGK
jgi:hypothetical protein